MPIKRVIAILVIYHGRVVQSIGFNRYLPVGRPEIAARFLSNWGVDEIVLVDITATAEGRTIDHALVEKTARHCYVPLTAGGGLRTVDDMRAVLQSGADKVLLNTIVLDHIRIIGKASEVFGNQCIIASIDALMTDGGWRVFGDGGRRKTGIDPAKLAQHAMMNGAGEILLNSIDQNGRRSGYDLKLAEHVGSRISVPLIIAGGAGHPRHFVDALALEHVAAAAAANFFHYTEHSIAVIKAWLNACGVTVRQDSYGDYSHIDIDEDSGRINKLLDTKLEHDIFKSPPTDPYDLL